MSHNTSMDTEPKKWPIAPDGYIPNSVLRGLMWKKKELSQPGSWNANLFSCHHQVVECTTNEQEDETTEKGEAEVVNSQKSKKEDRINEKKEDRINEKKEDRINEKKEDKINEKKEDKINEKKVEKINEREDGRAVKEDEKNVEENKEKITVVKARPEQETETEDRMEMDSLRKRPESPDGRNALPLGSELDSGASLKNIRSFLSAVDEDGQKPLSDEEDSMEPSDTITPPLQCLHTPVKHEMPNKDLLKLPVKHEVVSAVVTKTDAYVEGPPPLKAPPQDLKDLHPDLEPSLLTPDKCDTIIQGRAQLALNPKVMALYAKHKTFNRKSSQREKMSARAGSRLPHVSFQTDRRHLTLRDGLYRSWSTAQTASGGLREHNPPQIPDHVKDSCSMPEWRRNLYELMSQRGFPLHQPSPLPAADCPVKSSGAKQPPGTTEHLQSGLAAAPQRVVQGIRMRDSTEPAPRYSYHITPTASQLSFYTAQLRGKTQYGRLEFEWMRGSEEKTDADNHQ